MRRFQNENFPERCAQALKETYLYEIEGKNQEQALNYVGQFVTGPVNNRELVRGYLPERYADALVQVRDNNSSRKLNDAVANLCVDGNTSENVNESYEFVELTAPASPEIQQGVSENYGSFKSREDKLNASALSDLAGSNRERVRMFVPDTTQDELERLEIL